MNPGITLTHMHFPQSTRLWISADGWWLMAPGQGKSGHVPKCICYPLTSVQPVCCPAMVMPDSHVFRKVKPRVHSDGKLKGNHYLPFGSFTFLLLGRTSGKLKNWSDRILVLQNTSSRNLSLTTSACCYPKEHFTPSGEMSFWWF